jgi:HK97 family phage major capsid protein
MKSISMGEHGDIVTKAFRKQFGDYAWMMEIYADHVIIQDWQKPLYYKVTYTMSGIEVTFAARDAWELVEREYVPVAMGSAIKTLGDGKLGGHLIVYGDESAPDIEGDFFTKSTEFDFEDGDSRPVYYLHGLDGALKKRRIGKATLTRDEVGVWIEAQLDLRDEYEKAIYQMATDGKFGWSSGAAAHLVERERVGKSLRLKKWAIAEASLTPAPAEPRAQVVYVKSSDAALYLPEAQPEGANAPAGAAKSAGSIVITNNEDDEMNEEQVKALEASNAALKTQLDAVSEQMNKVLQFMQDAPAIKGAGYFTVDGGDADKSIKSLGDWALALARGDKKRLESVYKTTMVEGTGGFGGYTVPTEFSAMLLMAAAEASQIYARVSRMNVTAPTGRLPYIDMFTAPTAGTGQTAQAGRVTSARRTEAAAYTETEAQFEQLTYKVNDIASGMIRVSRELRNDSVIQIEQLLTTLIRTSVAAKLEYAILRGTGTGEPLGILNAPAKIDISPASDNVFAFADAVSMVSRFKQAGGAPVWILHPGMITDIAAMQVAASSPTTWSQDPAAQLRGTLLGYPLITSEHAPNPDTSGCIVLADLRAYLFFQLGELYIEFSDQRYFDTGEVAWRFGIRADGQPWWKGTQTLASPSAFTVSPFVSFND